jgi:hypothetical protein
MMQDPKEGVIEFAGSVLEKEFLIAGVAQV